MKTEKFGIYLHIPFCVRKCSYCDFLSSPASQDEMEIYVKALCQELTLRTDQKAGEEADTIYIGGGTPSILSGRWMEVLLDTVYRCYPVNSQAEITLEMNPGTASQDKLETYRTLGINRLSIGVQSANDQELQLLGRIHSWEQARESYLQARQAGFYNINLDLISGLPGQTLEDWMYNLRAVSALEPEHISAYSLIMEEGTPFFDTWGELPQDEEWEELDREIYHRTKEYLDGLGYSRYEISNYARPGYESRHNSSYWTGVPYMGFGIGAASLESRAEGWMRLENLRDRNTYCWYYSQCPAESRWESSILLTQKDRMEEFMFLGLRLTEGISIQLFEERFGCSYWEVYGEVTEKLVQQDLLAVQGDKIRLTALGLDLSNHVMAQLLL